MLLLSFIPTLSGPVYSLELIFRDTFTHGSGTGHTTRDHFEQFINVIGSRPFLMFEDFYAILCISLVNQ